MNLKQKKKMLSALLAFTMVLQMSLPVVFAEGEDSSSGTDDIMLSGSNQPTTTGGAISLDLRSSISEQLSSLSEGDTIIIDGEGVIYKGDISSNGLNITIDDYKTDGSKAIYKAGAGYALLTWPTSQGVPYSLTLHEVTVDTTSANDKSGISIFGQAIITLEGSNSIKATRDGICINNSNPELTIGGEGTLNIQAVNYDISSLYHGSADADKLTIKDSVKLNLSGGSTTIASGFITTKDNSEVIIYIDNVEYNYSVNTEKLSVEDNSKLDIRSENIIMLVTGDTYVAPTAKLNGIIRGKLTAQAWPHRVYGTVTVEEGNTLDLKRMSPLTAEENSKLINNGTLLLKEDISIENLKSLNITNNGTLKLGDKEVQLIEDVLYTDAGEITGDIDFKTNMPTEPTYYKKFDGYMLFKPASGTENAVLTLHGINLNANKNRLILPNEQVDIVLEGESDAYIIIASKNFNLKGTGTLNALRIETTEENVQMNIDSNVKLNAEYRTGSNLIMTSTFYGKNEVTYSEGLIVRGDQKVVLKSGSELKLGITDVSIGFMQIEEGSLSDIVIEEGASILNNTYIFLPLGTTVEQIKALNLKGTGVVRVVKEYDNGLPSIWDTFSNEGKSVTVINGNLTLDDIEITESDNKGYTWTKTEESGNEVWTLELKNIIIDGLINVPNTKTIINTQEDSYVNGGISKSTSYSLDLVFKGNGVLTIGGTISGGTNGDIVTIENGARINILGNISVGASGGGVDGTVIIDGRGTELIINSGYDSGIVCDTVKVQNGANVEIHSETRGIMALSGGVSVENGSTLETNCEYGVYILDGKLNVDDTSVLITDGSIAPFAIVDLSGTKVESDVVRLPGMPTNTKINSVTGDFDFYGTYRKYWSVTHDTGVLGVTDENSEPVTLTGAAIGRYIFKKAVAPTDPTPPTPTTPTNPSTPTDGGGGSSSNKDKKDSEKSSTSITPITIVKAEQTNPTFIDVNDSDWFKPAVDFVTGKGIMNGVEKNRFGPNISTTRGMIVTIFWQMENKPMPNDSQNYADVSQGQYFTDAVNWATENNIVVGYGNGNFGPNDTITREQMATILYQYCKYKNYDLNQGGMSTREFSDYENISPWALEYMTWAVNNQIISGVGNNMLNSRGHATRAQVAAILKNFYAIIDKQ